MKIHYYKDFKSIKVSQAQTTLYLITEDINLQELQSHAENDFFGAVVPHIITADSLCNSGILQITFDTNEFVKFHMSDMSNTSHVNFNQGSTLIMFSDSLSEHFEPFIDKLGGMLNDQTLFGSGVGSKDLKPISPLFDTNKRYASHSLIVEINIPIHIGVNHGWKALHGPLVVTNSKNNIIYELNNEPAFTAYAKVLSELDNQVITEDNFFDIAKAYPFGILSYTQNEFIVRDILQVTERNALMMVSSVKENETAYIMKGNHTGLINAALQNAKDTIPKHTGSINILFDCISRALYMEDDFLKEIACIAGETPKISSTYGITSIGEITNSGFDEIKIFNKTNLIGSINNAYA